MSRTKKLTVEAAFQRWMSGEPFGALKQAVGQPLMVTFTKLAGVTTWKQAVAKRQTAAKQAKRGRAAA